MDAHWTFAILARLALLLVLLVIDSNRIRADEPLLGPVDGDVVEIVDGDTLRVVAHVWLDQNVEILVRIRGIDAPERFGDCAEERALAAAASATLGATVGFGLVTLSAIEREKYFGRVVADVLTSEGRSVGPAMLASGHARPYAGGTREPWCPTPPPAAEPPALQTAAASRGG